MLRIAPFLFLFWIVVEVFLLVQAVAAFGFANIFFFWLLKTAVGVGIVKTTGLRLMRAMSQQVAGQPTGIAQAALTQLLLSLAGALLILPGFFTDLLAAGALVAVVLMRLVRFDKGLSMQQWVFMQKSGFKWQGAATPSSSSTTAKDFSSQTESPIDAAVDAKRAVIDVERLD